MLKSLSVAAFALMVVGIIGLYYSHALLAHRLPFIAVQVGAVLLMIAARITFGRRSFHASATPTAGGIVTSGPYAYLRHPIYSAALYFVWAGTFDSISRRAVACALAISVGALARMLSEERLLVDRYPEYRDYMARVSRIVPFVY
jgi:protein-S-isoprenylcysteine O-methyltransferase Ste14